MRRIDPTITSFYAYEINMYRTAVSFNNDNKLIDVGIDCNAIQTIKKKKENNLQSVK